MCSPVTVDPTHERALEHPTRPLSSLWIGEGATSGRGKSRTNWNKLSLAPSLPDRPRLFSLFLARCEKLDRPLHTRVRRDVPPALGIGPKCAST